AELLWRVASDEFHVALRRPAETADGRREPARLRRSLWVALAQGADRAAGLRIRSCGLARAALWHAVGRAAHARVAREGAAQPSRDPAARRADRLARPGHRRSHAHVS